MLGKWKDNQERVGPETRRERGFWRREWRRHGASQRTSECVCVVCALCGVCVHCVEYGSLEVSGDGSVTTLSGVEGGSQIAEDQGVSGRAEVETMGISHLLEKESRQGTVTAEQRGMKEGFYVIWEN